MKLLQDSALIIQRSASILYDECQTRIECTHKRFGTKARYRRISVLLISQSIGRGSRLLLGARIMNWCTMRVTRATWPSTAAAAAASVLPWMRTSRSMSASLASSTGGKLDDGRDPRQEVFQISEGAVLFDG